MKALQNGYSNKKAFRGLMSASGRLFQLLLHLQVTFIPLKRERTTGPPLNISSQPGNLFKDIPGFRHTDFIVSVDVRFPDDDGIQERVLCLFAVPKSCADSYRQDGIF